jgi:hypothetical protein
MVLNWENYDCHPEIGPLIEEYRHQLRAIEYVKRDLRTQDNIDSIMELSYEAAEIKRQIQGLVEQEQAVVAQQRRDTLWLQVTCIAIGVGVLNALIALGIF